MTECGCTDGCEAGWDRFQPATRELLVFTKSAKRYFDLDSVRVPYAEKTYTTLTAAPSPKGLNLSTSQHQNLVRGESMNHAGAPPLDWWEIPDVPATIPLHEGEPVTATFYVGDALEVMAKLPEKSVDLVLSSPPFLALRSYLPADHVDKAKEGGSQATPGEYIDWLVDVAEACARVLAPHGSLCFELGDTYSGGWVGESTPFDERYNNEGGPRIQDRRRTGHAKRNKLRESNLRGWALPKSLSLIPELFRLTLVYGINPLTGRQTERWRLRNVIRWVRPNPPVGALGDKFRPATSELMVFCKSAKRYFDLDAVREPYKQPERIGTTQNNGTKGNDQIGVVAGGWTNQPNFTREDRGGAPPLDWWEISLDGEEEKPYGPKEKLSKIERDRNRGVPTVGLKEPNLDRGDLGAGNFPSRYEGSPPLDWWNIPPGGYVSGPRRVNPGEYVDGTLYIASVGCPLHEGPLGRVAMARRDEPIDAPSTHSPDTGTSPVPVPPAGSAPTDQRAEPSLWDESSDSPDPASPPVATRRSKASNRTAPVPATTTPDTASDKSSGRTVGTSDEPPSDEPHPDNFESRTAAIYRLFPVLESYARTGHRPVELEGCDCSFYVSYESTGHYAVKPDNGTPLDWWEIPPGGYSGSHYAVFPPELCVKPIKAMCPEKVCRTCGEPRRRIVNDRNGTNQQPVIAAHIRERRKLSGFTVEEVNGWFGYATGIQHWESDRSDFGRIPNPDDWPVLKERLGLSDEFDDTVNGGNLAEYVPQSGPGKGTNDLPPGVNPSGRGFEWHEADRISPTGFSDCGHNDWRPGLVLDPFAGSGTTLAVATGHGREAVGIDLDERNYDLALERVGPMLLEQGEVPA